MNHIFISILCFTTLNTIGQDIKTGAERTELYIPFLQNKSVGVLVNQTSTINESHLVDSLIALNIDVKVIFAPEHGFRGTADAGETVENGKDRKTGVPIVSLYGKNKKPKPAQLQDIDVLLFDIQDVGVRFYTYISTMHYAMEAAAENDIPFMILDRPNPNGDYVAGPILDTTKYRSFVGMHPIPIVHGLTVGELARMVNNEGWLLNSIKCDLKVIPCLDYSHQFIYKLPIKPSPNLPTWESIRYYPSLCLMEPTYASIGRGTLRPFEIIGIPNKFEGAEYEFEPKSINGMSKYPKHQDTPCYGFEIQKDYPQLNGQFDPSVFLKMRQFSNLPFNDFVTSHDFLKKLVGNDRFYNFLKNGAFDSIGYGLAQQELTSYKAIRKQYLLYPDFE